MKFPFSAGLAFSHPSAPSQGSLLSHLALLLLLLQRHILVIRRKISSELHFLLRLSIPASPDLWLQNWLSIHLTISVSFPDDDFLCNPLYLSWSGLEYSFNQLCLALLSPVLVIVIMEMKQVVRDECKHYSYIEEPPNTSDTEMENIKMKWKDKRRWMRS